MRQRSSPRTSREIGPTARVARRRAILFTDVDGTLLDDSGRLPVGPGDLSAIAPWLDIVLASSRTLPELDVIRRRLGLSGPLVAENGALIAVPRGWYGADGPCRRCGDVSWRVFALGRRASRIRLVARRSLGAERARGLEEKALPPGAASVGRTHSLLLGRGRPRDDALLRASLESAGLTVTRSGRWLTVTDGADKGTGVRALLALASTHGVRYDLTAGIGNAQNDAPLLAATHLRLVVRNPGRGPEPALTALAGASVLSPSGIDAWPEAVQRVHAALGRE